MSLEQIQIIILNHRQADIDKFGKNVAAIKYYQEGSNSQLINDLYNNWFGIYEACIIAHHLSDIEDMKENVNVLVAVNENNGYSQYNLNKQKDKKLRYVFIFFNKDEYSARELVYQMLKPLVLGDQKKRVGVQVEYHNVTFI
ncbi:MAG: hypothetical protein ACRCST_02635 [Turicibacter sp.]